jgi:heme-degrading monooxygenase HmoA
MSATTDPAKRTAAAPTTHHDGPVTLVNSFVVPSGRDEAFLQIWAETSTYFRLQPGFIALRMHRAVTPGAAYRYVNVAVWASATEFAQAHDTDEFRRLVSQPALREFPASPNLYEVIAAYDASGTAP